MHEYDLCTLPGRVAQDEVVSIRGQKGLTEEEPLEIAASAPPLPGGWNAQKRVMTANAGDKTPPKRQKKKTPGRTC